MLSLFFLVTPFFALGQWSQVGTDFLGDSLSERFGYDAAISGDGTIVAVGSQRGADGVGFVQTYKYVAGTWDYPWQPNRRCYPLRILWYLGRFK